MGETILMETCTRYWCVPSASTFTLVKSRLIGLCWAPKSCKGKKTTESGTPEIGGCIPVFWLGCAAANQSLSFSHPLPPSPAALVVSLPCPEGPCLPTRPGLLVEVELGTHDEIGMFVPPGRHVKCQVVDRKAILRLLRARKVR